MATKESPENGRDRPTTSEELHVCMGLNACANLDAGGQASMAGTGQCATVEHVCHGEGACRGQGGCGYAGDDFEQFHPGEQSCRYNGSCASPINESRVFSAGPMKGKSVWQQARRLFEARMYAAGKAFGPSPGQGVPDHRFPDYDRLDRRTPVPGSSDKATALFRASADNPRRHEGETFPSLQAIARNSVGRHLPNVTLTFTIPDSASSLLYFKTDQGPKSSCSALTDSTGVATAKPLYAGPTSPGDQWVTVTATGPTYEDGSPATCEFHVTVLAPEEQR
ncbi:hypothetical protein SSP35_02_00830 [Streptomyces sp. NBRC 110611]|uniref:hypothetical protein n=1 Tax=Streptomyces sp. NBRC 110611 TaxID=1621259 RepID=UPI00082B0BEA|nr:hypothetical protein [Streptomyces sp. NBRC 110611]GAU65716.1 hypothetical protein SSP35_02_00830 [Streptomyces sp. NBRC 110611]